MTSTVQHRILWLFGIIATLFLVLILWQSYWHLFKSDWLMTLPGNQRLARAERNTPRGTIYDCNGERLAWTADGKRQYADSTATAAVLGYLDPVYGRVGVEGDWDLELAGLSTKFTSRELRQLLRHEHPLGKDLVLTLDLAIQHAALAALGDRRGAVVVLDASSGGILAIASSPTFDANKLAATFASLPTRSDGVLRNRAVQDRYPPGSTMKVLTASAALMHGVSPNVRYTCEGKTKLDGFTVTDYHGERHGTIAMSDALTHSCNYYFARTTVELGETDFFATAQAFGFGQRWWSKFTEPRILPFNVAVSSLAPASETKFPLGEFAQMGFGQATVDVTPLQMAMVAATIANSGTTMAPFLVQQVRKGGTTEVLARYNSLPVGYPLDSGHAQTVADMMRRVVTSGTATRALSIPGVTVYGKTGTAEQNGGEDHAWFIGFAERQQDDSQHRIAFAVIIERGGTGGRVAVPVALSVLRAWRDER